MKKQIISVFLGITFLLGFTGCAKYRAKPLGKLSTNFESHSTNSISFAYRSFDRIDCRKYLGRNVLAKGYQPIHVTLTNNSSQHFSVSTDDFSVPCAPAEVVAKSVHTSTVSRVLGYGAAAIIIWPFAIPAIIDGIGSHTANAKLDRDFELKEFRTQTIAPFGTANGIIFVPTDSQHQDLELTMVDRKSKKRYALTFAQPTIDL